MSRRVVVLLVVLGITVPYAALGAALWLSRGTGQQATTRFRTYILLTRVHGQTRFPGGISYCLNPHELTPCPPARHH
jgi:hypothetical protein